VCAGLLCVYRRMRPDLQWPRRAFVLQTCASPHTRPPFRTCLPAVPPWLGHVCVRTCSIASSSADVCFLREGFDHIHTHMHKACCEPLVCTGAYQTPCTQFNHPLWSVPWGTSDASAGPVPLPNRGLLLAPVARMLAACQRPAPHVLVALR
jgi:hypothetical protein